MLIVCDKHQANRVNGVESRGSEGSDWISPSPPPRPHPLCLRVTFFGLCLLGLNMVLIWSLTSSKEPHWHAEPYNTWAWFLLPAEALCSSFEASKCFPMFWRLLLRICSCLSYAVIQDGDDVDSKIDMSIVMVLILSLNSRRIIFTCCCRIASWEVFPC